MTFLLAFLKFIPGLSWVADFAEKIMGKYFDTKVALVSARLGVDRDVAVGMLKAAAQDNLTNSHKLGIFASNPLLTCLLLAFALPLALFMWKGIFVDKIVGPGCIWYIHACWIGHTDPITGLLADWGNTVIYFLFGAPTAMGIGKMWFGRNKTGE